MLLGVALGGAGSNEIQVEDNRRPPFLLSSSDDARS
jgi:hypothetical protein